MVLKAFTLRVGMLLLCGTAVGSAANEPNPTVTVSTWSVAASTPAVALSTTPAHVSSATWRVALKSPFRVGENLQFVVKWGVIVGGYAELTVPEVVEMNSRPTYHIISKARSASVVSAFYKVEDKNDVWLDQASLLTVRYERRIREGKFRIEEECVVDQPNRRWKMKSYRADKDRYEEKEGDAPLHALDPFGSLYYVRTLTLEPGQEHTIDVIDKHKHYPLVVKVLKREKIKVPAGKFKCILVEPILRGPGIFVAKGKKMQIWLTDDDQKMPIRMRSEVFIGHVSAELTKYTLGTP